MHVVLVWKNSLDYQTVLGREQGGNHRLSWAEDPRNQVLLYHESHVTLRWAIILLPGGTRTIASPLDRQLSVESDVQWPGKLVSGTAGNSAGWLPF